MRTLFFYSSFILLAFLFSCTKEDEITTDPSVKLQFSTDTLFFDTVFTSTGSTTRRIKVFNPDKRAVRIQQIALEGGPASDFQLNVSGVASNRVNDFVLGGNDSLNIFVKVNISPNTTPGPFIVEDAVKILVNGNQQEIALKAYGQNAVFLKGDVAINSHTTWDDQLPHVIYGKVMVNAEVTLTILKGAKVYFHKDAELIVGGTLRVSGELNAPVYFASDRLEAIYQEEPGQWKGIRFLSSSKDNHINYALIKNALTGLSVESLSGNSNPKLLLTNTRIYNMELYGLYCRNSQVLAFNNVIANCGRALVYGFSGGKYNFKHNTLVNLKVSSTVNGAAVFFTNKAEGAATSEMDLVLVNNIIWGSLPDELLVEKSGNLSFTQLIRNNVIKSRVSSLESSGNILNADPRFVNPRQYNFSLSSGSAAANKGENLSDDPHFSSWLRKDLKGKTRLFPSDLGSYEIM